MKLSIRLVLALALVLGFAPWAAAALEPFVKADWGASPVQVMDRMGVPAFNQIDYEAKRTEFIAYRQTVLAYNFVFYYFFDDDKLYQVRLELKEELWDTGVADLGSTINSMLEHALTTNARDGFSETTVQTRPRDGQPYASAMWWYTTETFALSVINAETADDHVLFDVLLADAANPANAELIGDYREVTAQIKAQNAARALAQAEVRGDGPGRFVPPTEEAANTGFVVLMTDKLRALAGGALNNWLRNAVIVLAAIIVLVLIVALLRKKRADKDGHWSVTSKASLNAKDRMPPQATSQATAKGSGPPAVVDVAAKTRPGTASTEKTVEISASVKSTAGTKTVSGNRQLRMVSASRPSSGKGSKLAFRK